MGFADTIESRFMLSNSILSGQIGHPLTSEAGCPAARAPIRPVPVRVIHIAARRNLGDLRRGEHTAEVAAEIGG